MRLPKKAILRWLERSYGVGGFENYEPEQVRAVMEGLKSLLEVSGSIELDYLGRLFNQLSNHPEKAYKLLNELEKEV